MKNPLSTLLTSAMLSLLPLHAAAQPAAASSAPATAASAPREAPDSAKLPQRRLPAALGHERATIPGDLRPRHPVAPLFSIPLGSLRSLRSRGGVRCTVFGLWALCASSLRA